MRIRAVVLPAALLAFVLAGSITPASGQAGGSEGADTEAAGGACGDDGGGAAEEPAAPTTTAEEPVAPTTTAEDPGTGVRAILFYDDGDETIFVEGVEITVETAAGEEIGTCATDAEGVVLLEVPGSGVYVVSIDPDTIPEAAELVEPDRLTLEGVTVNPRQFRPVAFPLQEEGAVSTRSVSSDWDRFLQLSVEGIKFGLVIAMMAVGLSLIFGTTGLTNFAHGELVVVGTVLVWYLNDGGLWLPLATVIGMVIMFGAGAGIDARLWRPLRRRGTSLIAMLVISIGVSLLVRYLVLYVFRGRPKAFHDYAVQKPYHFGSLTMVPKDLWAIGLSIAVLTAVGLVLTRTRTGKSIRAVADNPDLARSSGIDVDRVILVVWGAGSSLACLGGVLFAMSELVDWQFGFRLLLLMFAGVTLGGLGTAFGAFVGSLIVGVIIQVSTLWVSPELKNVSALGLLILILVIRPQGIFGQRERIG